MRTDVSITIDTEFSIAGALENPGKYTPIANEAVDCVAHGYGQGLPFLLETFARHNISATFFVEALNVRYFGDAPMGEIVSRILKAGQDVQLHIHPVWLSYEDGRLTDRKPNDSCDARQVEELCEIFQIGLNAFERWGIPRPVSLRTGGLRVDRAVYKALRILGIPAASSIGVGIFKPFEPTLVLHGGRRLIDGVMELPILSYRDFGYGQHFRSLQITACSWSEIKHILLSAHAAEVANVVILTHPFEYAKRRNFRFSDLTPNDLVKERLSRLCGFLSEHANKFRTVSFRDGVAEWLALGETHDSLLVSSLPRTLVRIFENGLNDIA